MNTLNCSGCGKKLLSYEKWSRQYKSPLKKCPKCGKMYADPRCHELAIEGIPNDVFSVKSNLILMIFGALVVWRGVYLINWLGSENDDFMPIVFIIVGAICIIGGIAEIVSIKTGRKARKFERLRMESEERLRDNSYAEQLREVGYKF